MMPALKAEFRKLATLRSTYVISGLILVILLGVNFWFTGYRADVATTSRPDMLYNSIAGSVVTVGLFAAIIAVLNVTHEYRYNTITYTLTAARSRLAVFFAKVIAIMAYTFTYTLLTIVLVVGVILLGVNLQGADLIQQDLRLLDLLWRSLLYAGGYSMFGLLLAFIIRNQVASIVTLLVWSTTVEPLLSLLLKSKAQYLPFMALSALFSGNESGMVLLPAGKAALTVVAYVLGLTIVAAILLRTRDAN